MNIRPKKEQPGGILIIDDKLENLKVLSEILKQQGYKIRQAVNGISALRAIQSFPPDLILLDIKMPEMDGYEVCQKLKQDAQTQEIPIIFISALNEVWDKVKAFQVGGVDYISKPFQVEEVIARIETQLIIQRQKRQLQAEIEYRQAQEERLKVEIQHRLAKEQQLKEEIIRRKETEEILYQSRALIQSVLNTSMDGIAAFQAVRDTLTGQIIDFRCLVVNPIISQILNKDRSNLMGKIILKRLLKKIDVTLFEKFVHLVETGIPLIDDIFYRGKNTQGWYHFIAVKLGDGFSIAIRDITERKQIELDLSRWAKLDGLTGVANRHYFDQFLNQEWLRNQQEKQPISLILCDVDYFKAYNDTYGHLEGDDCLKKVAKAIEQVVQRPGNLLARYGGEEFVIILTQTNLLEALQIATEIQASIQALNIPHAQSQVSDLLTISLGISSLIPTKENSIQVLIKGADEALYEAKQKGRNRIITKVN
ncbi:Response regulator receiver modulated diguanylate cyclase [Planktothrix serta PCC 8927]|uniref:Response regulator receiver modulated diguanylate cyclase n=1 Tax=Planktothrix serta PCC 8927 TaxID=671068 RepID=A0A7Z9BPL4_9CYAN|nr:diguanylate cyclase [Planktothrix serta]VXD19398.1 Response regulator receiver modulated diguanylate cyclase [Planktothrix serta PCC 8927]